MKACEHGPVVVVYPGGTWYGGIDSEEKIDAILDEDGKAAEEFLIA